ncbi:PH domain-containing protein [Nitriliruptoraceae bacterium ZYF776]|nr:PH domain-containing protein [Profundirhabdus halotolerans]
MPSDEPPIGEPSPPGEPTPGEPTPGEPTPGGPAPTSPPPTSPAPDVAPPAPGEHVDDGRERKLHPASVVLGVSLRQLLQGIVVPAFAGAAAGPGLQVYGAVLAGLLAIGLVVRVLAWRRFRFSFDGEVLRVDEGVLRRSHRSLDVARIQQVELERSLLQRALGLASLRVETAGASSEPEVELRVLREAEARELRTAVRAGKARATGGPEPAPAAVRADRGADRGADHGARAVDEDGRDARSGEPILHVGVGRLVLAAITGSQLLVLPAVLAGALQFLGDGEDALIDVTSLLRGALELGIVALVALLIPAALLSAIVVGVLRDFDWTLRRVDDDLHVSRGLLSTREAVLPLSRVQKVEIKRNGFRRLLGYAAVRIHSAGGSGDDRRVTVPLLHVDEVAPLLPEILPGVAAVPDLARHPRNARRRAVFRWVRDSLWIAVPLTVATFVPDDAFPLPELADRTPWIAAGLVVVAAVFGLLEHAHLAHGTSDRVVASRFGAVSVTTGLAPLVKVQGVTTRSSWFQRRLDLVTVTAHVAGPGGDLDVLDCGTEDGRRLHAELTVHAADPVVPAVLADADTGVPSAPEGA